MGKRKFMCEIRKLAKEFCPTEWRTFLAKNRYEGNYDEAIYLFDKGITPKDAFWEIYNSWDFSENW